MASLNVAQMSKNRALPSDCISLGENITIQTTLKRLDEKIGSKKHSFIECVVLNVQESVKLHASL